jgi:hypothetical protein
MKKLQKRGFSGNVQKPGKSKKTSEPNSNSFGFTYEKLYIFLFLIYIRKALYFSFLPSFIKLI